jgi:hypothetical protein
MENECVLRNRLQSVGFDFFPARCEMNGVYGAGLFVYEQRRFLKFLDRTPEKRRIVAGVMPFFKGIWLQREYGRDTTWMFNVLGLNPLIQQYLNERVDGTMGMSHAYLPRILEEITLDELRAFMNTLPEFSEVLTRRFRPRVPQLPVNK